MPTVGDPSISKSTLIPGEGYLSRHRFPGNAGADRRESVHTWEVDQPLKEAYRNSAQREEAMTVYRVLLTFPDTFGTFSSLLPAVRSAPNRTHQRGLLLAL